MKKSIIILSLFILSSLSAFAQWNNEYDYFSLKAGATHTLFTPQPGDMPNKMVYAKNGYDQYQVFPDTTKFNFNYAPGYYVSFMYNHDLKNNKIGLSIGLDYRMYGIVSNYTAKAIPEFSYREIYRGSQISLPFYIKYGKKFYESQRYLYFGGSLNYNLFLSKTEKPSYSETSKSIKLDKAALKKSNFNLLLGFNYMFFNFEVGYVFGNFLSKNYSMELPDGSTIKPYETQAKNNFLFKTGITIPLNSWTPRKVYAIEMWFRRILK